VSRRLKQEANSWNVRLSTKSYLQAFFIKSASHDTTIVQERENDPLFSITRKKTRGSRNVEYTDPKERRKQEGKTKQKRKLAKSP
jgi:hypothetical protein